MLYVNYISIKIKHQIRSDQLLSHVQPFVTPWTAAHQAPLSMGLLQARILEWVAIPSSRGSSQPRDQTQVSCTAGEFFTVWDTREALYPLLSEWVKWSHPVMSDSLWPHGLFVAHQTPPSMEFSRQEYWSGLPFPSPGNLPDPGI